MKKNILLSLVLYFVSFASVYAQNVISYPRSVNDTIQKALLNTSAHNVVIRDWGPGVDVIASPASENEQCIASFELHNKGFAGGIHKWVMQMASYADSWGVKSNGYEIWECPSLVSGETSSLRRFVIQTSRDNPTNYFPVVIGPRGGLSIGYSPYFSSPDINDLSVNGNVGIGTLDTQGYKLAVNGIIRAKEIKVESGWADFVFKKDYRLPTLKEVEEHINENGTLPSVPTEQEVKANGINLAETNALLLQKIEELTLYIIQQDKRIETLESKMNNVSGNNK